MVKKKVKKDKKCFFTRPLKNISRHDIVHAKIASIMFTLFLIVVWKGFANFIYKIHWGWFLALAILFAIKPISNCIKNNL